jgi:hypothetical protein
VKKEKNHFFLQELIFSVVTEMRNRIFERRIVYCSCMLICIYVCMYMYVVCMYVCMYVCMCMYVCVCMYV